MAGSKYAVVVPVMAFLSSSRLYPMASLAATFAIGYPVAFDASAEERETRGCISIPIISSSLSGLNANCTLQPPRSEERRVWKKRRSTRAQTTNKAKQHKQNN